MLTKLTLHNYQTMINYNSMIILEAQKKTIPYVYALFALKRELKKLHLVEKCHDCGKKMIDGIYRLHDKDFKYFSRCQDCKIRILNLLYGCDSVEFAKSIASFSFKLFIPYESFHNYNFNYNNFNFNFKEQYCKNENEYHLKNLPNELINVIISNLDKYDAMNFCIAIKKCDKEVFDNILKCSMNYNIKCWKCKEISAVYYNCGYCSQRLCDKCVVKCEDCNNRMAIWIDIIKIGSHNKIECCRDFEYLYCAMNRGGNKYDAEHECNKCKKRICGGCVAYYIDNNNNYMAVCQECDIEKCGLFTEYFPLCTVPVYL